MNFVKALISTIFFISVLFVIYIIHVNFFSVNVVFYSSVFDVVLAATISGVVLLKMNLFNSLSYLEKFMLVVLWLLSGYSIAISLPTVIDRSLSFYILEKIQQRGGGIKFENFDEVFTVEYLKEHRLVDVRLTEQLESGTITIENGCVKLTTRGERIASFGRYFRKNLLPKKRLLMGEYTDILTDPFRSSKIHSDYICE